MTKKLILFDIDHTLMDVGDTHKAAFAYAFKEVLDMDLDYSKWRVHGYTDLQIIDEFMDKHGHAKEPEKISKIIDVMIEYFKKQNIEHAFLLDGAIPLIKELKKNKEVILGLVTGNIEEIGYTKLKHFGIDEYFVLGGFGDISIVRADLVFAAIKQAERDFGKINKSDVFIIGDTVHDIKAAKDSNVKVIAVSSGTYTYAELKEKKPDYLFHDLKNTKKIIDVITNE